MNSFLKRLPLSILIVLGLLAGIMSYSTPAAAQDSGPIYVVEAGDSLAAIALKFGVSVAELAATNNINDPTTIQPGQNLVIPGFSGISGQLTTRPVAFGETLWSLSVRHGLPYDELGRLNRIVHPGRLYVGQEVILPAVDEQADALPEGRPAGLSKPTLLESAIQGGFNPHQLRIWSGHTLRYWDIEDEKLALPYPGRATLDLPAPILSVEVNPQAAVQGRTVVVTHRAERPLQVSGQLGDWVLFFGETRAETDLALQGIHPLAAPGLYDLSLQFADESGPIAERVQPLRVRSGGYGFDPILYVPAETLDPANTGPEDRRLDQVFSIRTDERLWQGAFDFPSQHFVDAFPSVFGTRRNYNETGYNSYHTGLDFYGGVGLEVYAPARGRVVLADELTVRGNTTIIDHGLGVFTVYMHQSEILVELDQMVERGDLIGLVGATGRVTGPHLHWEVRAGGIPVDPLEWVEQEFP